MPVDGYNTALEADESGEIWRGNLVNGGKIEIPAGQIFKVERYRVTANWGGNGHKTREMTEDHLCDYVENRGGNGDNISKIKDSKGNVVYDRDEGNDKALKIPKN